MYYVAKLTPESTGGYSVTFPDIPGCISQGDTLDEALAMAKDALDLFLEVYLDGTPIPDPDTDEDTANGLYAVYVDETLAANLKAIMMGKLLNSLDKIPKSIKNIEIIDRRENIQAKTRS